MASFDAWHCKYRFHALAPMITIATNYSLPGRRFVYPDYLTEGFVKFKQFNRIISRGK